MLHAKDYQNPADLVKAVKQERIECYSQYNRNPSVKVIVHEPFKDEWYEAMIHWHPFEKHWILGLSYHGKDNQGRRTYQSMGAKAYQSLNIIALTIATWHDVGTPRINLTMKRWKEQGHGY